MYILEAVSFRFSASSKNTVKEITKRAKLNDRKFPTCFKKKTEYLLTEL
jgi:hypothetical protein